MFQSHCKTRNITSPLTLLAFHIPPLHVSLGFSCNILYFTFKIFITIALSYNYLFNVRSPHDTLSIIKERILSLLYISVFQVFHTMPSFWEVFNKHLLNKWIIFLGIKYLMSAVKIKEEKRYSLFTKQPHLSQWNWLAGQKWPVMTLCTHNKGTFWKLPQLESLWAQI